ncbi:hypothetical protein WJX72_003251 [[Myrmecia] bisecta]|uniref:Phospholipid-transporting ATPase n=1 Tax=[Myrmecia] bisecta TaxID=41462 RepID=A0AAW1PNK4_9CHLO
MVSPDKQLASAKADTQRHIQQDSFREGKEGGQAAAPSEGRTVQLDMGRENDGFIPNDIKTAKYNVATFVPRFLFEMFSRAAYLYFLAQACLAWWSVVSPFGGFGSTAALVFVLVVAAIKAIWEDVKRHQEDRRTNSSLAHVVQPDGSEQDVPWRDIKVGQILKVKDGELFPADLLCLYSALPDKVCFIKTTNLDGESNLKIRRPLDLKDQAPEDCAEVLATRGTLECEPPNANLHRFTGRFTSLLSEPGLDGRVIPVTVNEMLLRGCMLKNTGYVLGLVVYTGSETRIQMNAAKTPNKVGSYDIFLNLQICLIIVLQIAMCLFCAIASYIWRRQAGFDRTHLALNVYVQGNYNNGFVYTCILLITFWILYSYLVPISLFVTLEIVKFWQAFIYINLDDEMRDPVSGDHARARNSNLNEDLGKVEYVFSDKTGTLTSNEMQMREMAIKGVAFGDTSFRLEDNPEVRGKEALQRFDPKLASATSTLIRDELWEEVVEAGGSSPALLALPSSHPSLKELQAAGIGPDSLTPDNDGNNDSDNESSGASVTDGEDNTASPERGEASGGLPYTHRLVLGHHLVDFWTNICVCHTLIVEKDPVSGEPVYQGPSPDEVALVEAGRQLGFEFLSRSQAGVVLRMRGVETSFEVLNVMEFSSDRGRMSVIARAKDGTIRLFCKGSDAKMLQILRKDMPARLLDDTNRNLHLFATQGLRTLVLGSKVLEEAWWAEWDARYQEAAGSLDDREGLLAQLAQEVEADLDLVGCTAIEDKLQDGVPAAIQSLLSAGIKVWVITGDKQETAINIAISCKLVHDPDNLLICNADSAQAAQKRLQELLEQINREEEPVSFTRKNKDAPLPPTVKRAEMVIDGTTLSHVLGTPAEKTLAQLGSQCGSVVICRASPSQKAAIVRLMLEFELKQAEGGSTGMTRYLKRRARRMESKMLAIGDGANDVAMIQAADVGVGIMGKEGRQAVNNSDYAIGQFRFLVRLLLVHGTLCSYRLARLIKYSFYKNIAFAFILFFYQFYCGYSGQTLVDDISAAAYNVVFTSVPILFFAILDRPVRNLSTLLRYPQMYNHQGSLNTRVFWKSGVLMAIIDAAICFFVPYYSIRAAGQNSMADVYSVGKTVFIALLGAVSLEVGLISRFWTYAFGIVLALSYALVYPFELIFPLLQKAFNVYDPGQWGVAEVVFSNATFWLLLIVCNFTAFGHRYLERSVVWLYRPQDNMVMQEMEVRAAGQLPMGWQTRKRLAALGPRHVDDRFAADVEVGAAQPILPAGQELSARVPPVDIKGSSGTDRRRSSGGARGEIEMAEQGPAGQRMGRDWRHSDSNGCTL